MNPVVASSLVNAPGKLPVSQPAPMAKSSGSDGFANLVDSFVQQTNEAQVTSDTAIDNLITGKTDNIQQVVMAVANAEMSFQLFMEIRNNLIDSYNELMRMQF